MSLALVALLGACQRGATSPENRVLLPEGWQPPTIVENSECDRGKSDLFSVVADFDADKKRDVAKVLATADGRGRGAWVWLSARREPILLTTFGGALDVAIKEASAGTHATLCGKGYESCAEGEPASMTLSGSGLDLINCGVASELAVWDAAAGKFQLEPTSD